MNVLPRLRRFNWPFPFFLLFSALLFFFRLGVPGLMDPDEGRYAEIAREMLVSGDFITPQLNFLPYLEKPPLVYWLTALSLWLGGCNEWAARLVPALSAWFGVMAVYWLTARLWDPRAGFVAGLVTATSSGYFLLGRILTLDMTLTAFLTWGIALAYLAVRDQQRHLLFWAYLAFGLGVLAKGPVAVVLPALIFLVWFLIRQQYRGIFQLWHTGGICLMVLMVLPWYILVGFDNPDFWHYFFWEEHLKRYLTNRIHAGQPVYFYLGVLLTGLAPWILLLPWAWRVSGADPDDPAVPADRLFLWVWFGAVFVFFSLARAKLFPYLLPGLPPLAILVGQALAGRSRAEVWSGPWWRWSLRVWLVLALLLVTGLLGLEFFIPQLSGKVAFLGPYPLAYGLVLALPPALLLSGLASPSRRLPVLLGAAVLLNLILMLGVDRLAEIRSPRAVAQFINSHRQADDIILGYQNYSQGISFYTGQPLYLFGVRGELDFGLRQRPDNPYYLSSLGQMTDLLQRHRNFVVIIDPENFKIFQDFHTEPVTFLTQWKNYLIIRSR